MISPQGWGAQVDYDSWNDPFTPDDGVALHHGGGGNYLAHLAPYSREKEEQQLRAWENYHLSKGWRGLAYGFAVGQTGNVYRIRGFNRYGAHTGDVDGDGIANNDEIVPILFIGSGSRVRLSPAAQDAIESLRRDVIEPRSPKARWLHGHQEITKGTSCPGQFGMEYVLSHRLLPEEDDMPTVEEIARAVWADRPGGDASAYQTLIRTKAGVDSIRAVLGTENVDTLSREELEDIAQIVNDELARRAAD